MKNKELHSAGSFLQVLVEDMKGYKLDSVIKMPFIRRLGARMGKKNGRSRLPENPLGSSSKPFRKPDWLRSIVLFIFAFSCIEIWLVGRNPVGVSGDAASIWKAIVGLAEGNPVGSYVMYKGIVSCYPYVWFYQLSVLFGLPNFFFVKFYHGVLFAYITTIGVPCLVEYFFCKRPKAWQVLCFTAATFLLWRPTYALDQLMVDLPCCAFFFLAIHLAIRLEKFRKQYAVAVLVLGFICGLNATVSGQYSLAMLCILVYAAIQIFLHRSSLKEGLLYLLFLTVGFAVPFILNMWFKVVIVDPLAANGTWIPQSNMWLRLPRGLLHCMPYVSKFPNRFNQRGYAILEGVFGSSEAVTSVLQSATTVWTVREWFATFLQYPLDFLAVILDKAFICVTTDGRSGNIGYLVAGYTLLYIAIYEMVRRIKSIKNVFQSKAMFIVAALMSILACLVVVPEPRYTISLQGVIFGAAMMGPLLECWRAASVETIKKLVRGEVRLENIYNSAFPWGLVIGIVFVATCILHYGDLMGHTYSGLELLFTK